MAKYLPKKDLPKETMKKRNLSILLGIIVFCAVLLWNSQPAEAAESNDYYIKVNKGTNVVTVYTYKGNKPVKAMICSAGEPTQTGTYYTPAKYRWKELIGPSYGQYSTRIYGGVLFHSVFYWTNGDKSSMSTSAYNLLGTLQSHGCIRLLVKDAKWIYDNCALGTKVIIFNGTSKDDPLGRPTYGKILNGKYTNWDPTDPDPKNPWRKCKPSLTITGKRTIQYNSTFDPFSVVTVKDSLGNVVNSEVTVKGKVNTKKLGYYTLTYKYTDFLGRSINKKVKYKVTDMKAPVVKGVKTKQAAMGASVNLKKGITAKSATGQNLTDQIRVYVRSGKNKKYRYQKSGSYTFTKAGTYKIYYYVRGTNKRSIKVYSTVVVTDQRVNLSAVNTTVEYGASFNKSSVVKILQTYKGKNLSKSKNLKISGSVNTKKVGSYKLTVTGMHGNKAYTKRTKTVTVKVVNKKAPVIYGVPTAVLNLKTTDNKTLSLLSGVTAKTATGVNLTPYLKVTVNGKAASGNYTFNKPGTYTITYTVSVPNGSLSKSVSRKVVVTEPEPEIPTPPETTPDTNTEL